MLSSASAVDVIPGASVRGYLRACTAALHARVDAAMPLSHSSATLADYYLHLLILADWLDALGGPLPDLALLAEERRAVARDIAGCVQLRASAGEAPSRQPLPGAAAHALGKLARGPHGDAARWGVRYVIEGSRLGGQVLQRRLAAALAPHPLDYLRGGGADGRWRDFLLALAGQDWSAPAQQAAGAAAQHTFELLIECLHARQSLHQPVPS